MRRVPSTHSVTAEQSQSQRVTQGLGVRSSAAEGRDTAEQSGVLTASSDTPQSHPNQDARIAGTPGCCHLPVHW